MSCEAADNAARVLLCIGWLSWQHGWWSSYISLVGVPHGVGGQDDIAELKELIVNVQQGPYKYTIQHTCMRAMLT